jgi:hypothetical protein
MGEGEFQRYGIFMRDDGLSSMDRKFEGRGNCYALLYDSDSGRVRPVKIVDSIVSDLLQDKHTVTTDEWHLFRIESEEDTIRFFLDRTRLLEIEDTTFISGPCGMGYSNHANQTWPKERGAWFDNFKADEMP